MSRDIPAPQSSPPSVTPVPVDSRADRLAAEAAEAAQVRALTSHPDVVALRVEKVRRQVDAFVWAGIVLGLAFTMVNVQHFAAAGAPPWSLPWLAAWLLDPMVSLVLMAVLLAEQVTARYQVPAAPWARRAKWFSFTSTYVMNTWTSWASLDPAGIVLHSVPPLGVLCAAEAAPWLRDRLTEAVHAAARDTERSGGGPASWPLSELTGPGPLTRPDAQEGYETGNRSGPGINPVATGDEVFAASAEATTQEPAEESAREQDATESANTTGVEHMPTRERASTAPARPAANTATGTSSAGRKLLGDYVAEARAALGPDTEISPAWVRQVTDCARSTSARVAAELRTEQDTAPTTAAGTPAVATVAAEPVPAAEPVREAA